MKKELIIKCIQDFSLLFNSLSEEYRFDKEIALIAMSMSGYNIISISDEMQDDKDIAIKSISQNRYCLKYVSKELKNNKKIMLEALNNDEHYIYYASKELKDDKELLEIYFEYFPVENANDYDFYKECELKLKLLKEQEWLEQNAPKNIIKSKPGKF